MEHQRPAAARGRNPRGTSATGAVVNVSSAAVGRGRPVQIEVQVAPSPSVGFAVTGYHDSTARELRDRLRAAVTASGLTWPDKTISLKVSPRLDSRRGPVPLDLPIAMALLAADGQVPTDLVTGRAFLGQLGLDGSIRPVENVFALVSALRGSEVVVPVASLPEARAAAQAGDIVVLASYNLNTLLATLDRRHFSPGVVEQPTAVDKVGDRYVSEVGGTVFESLGDGRYAVVDGPHGVPAQLRLGTVVATGFRLDTWRSLTDTSSDRPNDQAAPAPPPARRAEPAPPYLRRAGDRLTPAGWVTDPAGRWQDQETEVVYDPRRHEVAITQTQSTGSVAFLEATGWKRLDVDGPRGFWARDRLDVARAALDRHDRAVIAGTGIATQADHVLPDDAPGPPGP